MGLFQSFIGGMEAGEDHRQRRTQRTALEEAGQLYGIGKTDAAENALVAAGMPEVAANYSALGEARRARTTRRNVAAAMQGAGQSATDQASAASEAAIAGGDPELALQFRHEASQLSAEERQRRAADHEQAAQIALTILPTVPMEQRAERMVQETVRLTGASEEEVRRNVAQLDLSDEGLQAIGQSALSIGDIYAGRERRERYAVEDSHWGEEMGLRRAALDAGRRPENLTPLQVSNARASFASASGLLASYNNFLEMLRNASTEALAGMGPDGAALQSARTLLSIQAKSPAALDLGALVGADFTLLGNTVGDDNWATLVRQGGREGALRRLEPFGQFLEQGRGRLRTQYEPWAHQMPDMFSLPLGQPPEIRGRNSGRDAAPSRPAVAPAPSGGGPNYAGAIAAFDAGPDTPARRAGFERDMGISVDDARRQISGRLGASRPIL